jgi:hypothetical protein
MYQTRKQVSMVLVVGAIGLLIMLGTKNSDSSAEEKRQTQSTTTVCDEDTGSCEVSFCDDRLPCETSSIPNPSNTEPMIEDNGEEARTPQESHPEEERSGHYTSNSEPDDKVPLGFIPWLIEGQMVLSR